ncbi:MAG: DUF1841 family protein [Mariprofundaceae bacterium]
MQKQEDRAQLRAHRKVFWDTWRKVSSDLPLDALEVRIARVIHMHPEYYSLFDDEETFLDRDYQVDDGSNPYLHLSLHMALEEQVATHHPPELAIALEALMRKLSLDRHDALHQLLDILAEVVHDAQRQDKDLDTLTYATRLREVASA